MEDLLDLDLDVGSCSWRFWDGLDQDVSYFDAVLPLDADFGLCSTSSEENTLTPSPPSEDSATTTSADSTTFEPHLGDNIQDGVSESTVESVESTAGSKATSRNAARERSRVRSLRSAFQALQMSLPSVPPDTKLSKLDVLVLASNYIAHLGALLSGNQENADTCLQEQVPSLESASSRSYLHPVKKWPMRSRLYAGASPYADDRSKRHNCTDQWQAKKSRSSKPSSNRRNALA